MPVIDATFLIDLEHDHPAAVRAYRGLLAQDERLLVPAQAATEFLTGAQDPLIAFRRLRESFDLVLVGHDEILEASRLARLTKSRGHRPRWADTAIGAVAMLRVTYVLTANPRDFLRMDVPAWDYRNDDRPTAAA